MSRRIVLHEADIARALTRISHEILESNRGPEDLVLLGIPTRGVTLAAPHRTPHRASFGGRGPIPVGLLDVTMYRDDLHRNPTRAPQPTQIPPGGIDGKVVVLVDDVLFSGRTHPRGRSTRSQDIGRPAAVRLGARSSTAATATCPSALDFVGKNLPSSARRARQRAARPRSTAAEEVTIESMRAPARHQVPVPRGRAARSSTWPRTWPTRRQARGQEAPGAARQDRGQPLLRGLHAHPHLVRGRRQAPLGRRRQLLGQGLERLQGRVACRTPRRPSRRWGRMPW